MLVYRCGFAVEHTYYKLYDEDHMDSGPVEVWDKKKLVPDEYKDRVTKVKKIEPVENALHLVKTTLTSICTDLGVNPKDKNKVRLFLTGEGNFREKVAVTKPYKGNRDPLHKPKWYKEIKEYLIRYWNAEVVDGIEADDSLGIIQMEAYNYNKSKHSRRGDPRDIQAACSGMHGGKGTIICSNDKDMSQIPGWHYDFTKKNKYWVSEEEADRWFYIQLLAGDPTDNIPGIPGVGIKTAQKLLKDCTTEKEMYDVCWKAYGKHISPEWSGALSDSNINNLLVNATITEMANLVYIMKEKDKYWEPPV